MKLLSTDIGSTVIKQTTSRCPVCNALTDNAVVFENGNKVYMSRTCAEHGEATFCISSDARLFHTAVGPPMGDCCGGSCGVSKAVVTGGTDGTLGANATHEQPATPEILSSCVTLIEITHGCNMSCPTCFADALKSVREGHMPFDEFVAKIEGIIARKGPLEILQLSGGEPTIHPEFLRILEWSCNHPQILCVLVNTNGIKAATDAAFMAEMARIEEATDKIQIYLQFDGIQEDSQHDLRGGDFRRVRLRALDRFKEAKIPVTLAMVVTPKNLPVLWDTVMFGIGREEISGISFQPEFFSGRTPHLAGPLPDPISVADVIMSLCAGSGIMKFDQDFTPTPCGDPMCQWIGWLGKGEGGKIDTASTMGLDLPKLQALIGNRIRYDVNDLIRCQCDSTGLGHLIHQMEGLVQQTKVFRLFIKPFMDARMWDEDRIARCCTHVVRHDGKLDSFCRYYANGGADGDHSVGKKRLQLAEV
jgi:7,8-dihydro-6-hydroxymethylpterin dimethyltransferase